MGHRGHCHFTVLLIFFIVFTVFVFFVFFSEFFSCGWQTLLGINYLRQIFVSFGKVSSGELKRVGVMAGSGKVQYGGAVKLVNGT